MIVELFFELHDDVGGVHHKFQHEFDDQSTLKQLKNEVKSTWNIDDKYQLLFFADGRELIGLGTTSIQSIGLKHGGKVVVKHSMLPNWTAFCERNTSARKSKQEHRIKVDVDKALRQLKLLESTNFLEIYARLDSTVRAFSDDFAHFLDADNKYIEGAAKDYFSKLFNDSPENPQVEVKCKPKENIGAQGGLICEVMKGDSVLGKFHVKTHLGTATRSSKHTSADLRELFVYRLLEMINVGPEVHFVPNDHHSLFGLYIATKDVVGFTRALEARSTISGECKLQLEILRRILYLSDLHSANYGLDDHKNLCIVDFQVDHHTKSADIKEYLHADREERIRVGRLSYTKWNLVNIVEDADKRITVQKDLFKKKRVSFLPTKNYNEYLSQVKKNIIMFADVFV